MVQAIPFRTHTILVVEDEALIRMELAAQLRDIGLRVFAASNADEAIELLDIHPEIDVMMTDIRMPGSMNGVRLAHHVRRRWPPIKIIVLSGLERTPISDLPNGSAFVAKPYEMDTVRTALAPFLDHPDDQTKRLHQN